MAPNIIGIMHYLKVTYCEFPSNSKPTKNIQVMGWNGEKFGPLKWDNWPKRLPCSSLWADLIWTKFNFAHSFFFLYFGFEAGQQTGIKTETKM